MTTIKLLPEHMRDGMQLYVDHGIEPGSFMTSVLANDLKQACACADDINRYRIFDIVSYCYNYIPSQSWGSYERVEAWIKQGGMLGRNRLLAKEEV